MYDKIIACIKEAGSIIKQASLDESQIYAKEGEANFVTYYDKKVQKYLVSRLTEICPEAHFLAEEDGVQQSLGDGYCYIIDPIDGTTNFIHDYFHSCISVGLAYAGEMVFGVVYQPYTEEMFTAQKGHGAFLNGRPIQCAKTELSENIASFGCAKYNTFDSDLIFSYAKALYMEAQALRCGGSAALDICRAACGRNGLYIEMLLQPWDYAASSLILTEAGGVIETVEGGKISLDKPCSILAGSVKCVEAAKRIGDKCRVCSSM
jgi:myo-inositol-1(or 4)-monophosphatase